MPKPRRCRKAPSPTPSMSSVSLTPSESYVPPWPDWLYEHKNRLQLKMFLLAEAHVAYFDQCRGILSPLEQQRANDLWRAAHLVVDMRKKVNSLMDKYELNVEPSDALALVAWGINVDEMTDKIIWDIDDAIAYYHVLTEGTSANIAMNYAMRI